MLPNYVHKKLTQQNSTRVLLLNPASIATAPVRCSLVEIVVDSPPEYTALSYAWDAQQPSCAVECDGGTLLVTSNCLAALQQLRHHHDTRRLWVDSICIDQGSFAERSQQVARMGDIYKRAAFVIVWLGQGNAAG